MFDPVAELRVAVKEVAAEDRAGWGGLALADRVLGLSQASERLLVEVIRALASWDGLAAWALDGALSPTGWLVHRLPVTEAEARGLVKIAVLYRRHDCVAAALDGGEIGVAHARVMKNAAAGRDDAFTACAPGLVGLARDHPLVKDFAQVMAEWMRLVDDREPHDDAGRAFRIATTFGGAARTEISGSADDAELIRAAIEADDTPDSPDCPEGPRTRAQRHYDIAMDIFARALADRLGTDPESTGTADVIVDADTVAELLRDPDIDDDGQDPLDEFFDRHGITDPAGPHHHHGHHDEDRATSSSTDARGGPEPQQEQPDGDGRGDPPRERRPRSERHGDTADGTNAHRGATHEGDDTSNDGATARPASRAVDPWTDNADDPLPNSCCDANRHGGRRCEHPTGATASETFAAVLLCSGWVRKIVRDPHTGEIIDLGRRQRPFSRAQRRALVHRDRGCVFPGCDRGPRWCDAHHLRPWEDGGLTDLVNGVLLCRRHHQLVHRGWRLTRDPRTGTVTATSPDGRTFTRTPDDPRNPLVRC